jgi:hypothetical protein
MIIGAGYFSLHFSGDNQGPRLGPTGRREMSSRDKTLPQIAAKKAKGKC